MEALIAVIKISLVLAVFALGLSVTPRDLTYGFLRPGVLLRALLAMFVMMPAIAAIIAVSFDLAQPLEIALVALAVSPTPALQLRKASKSGGSESYAVGVLVATSLLAIIWIPLSLEILERIFAIPLEIHPLRIAGLVMTTVLTPLGAGIVVRALAPGFAHRAAAPCSTVAGITLLISLVPVLIVMFRPMLSLLGNGTLAAIVGFTLVGLVAGHLLGGPSEENRKVLALYTISRHPGIAVAIAQANFPEQRLAVAAIVLAVLVSSIVSLPYLRWAKTHQQTAAPAE
jgi:BASS family bile acid:Na+ symporter